MKRLKHAWDSIISNANITMAVYRAIENKHDDPVVKKKLLFDEDKNPQSGSTVDHEKVRKYAENIQNIISDEDYQHKKPRYKHLYCTSRSKGKNGKWRDIYCPSLCDHIIHHALIQKIRPTLMRGMIEQCCGSVPGRGQKAVKEFVEGWLRTDPECKFFVKLDIRHFFDSIPKDKLKARFRKSIADEKVLCLIDKIIDSSPSACPVGYYTSPWFSNFYLQDFDHFVKQDLYKLRRGKRVNYVKHYVRYADDMLLVGSSKRDLEKSVRAIIEYLAGLGLEIKSCWEIKKVAEYDENHKLKKGTYRIDICGYVFDREKTVLRPGIYLSSMRMARRINKRYRYTGKKRLYDCQVINSNLGWAYDADCAGMIAEIDRLVNIKDTRKVISNASKCGIFRETGETAV